MKITIDSKVLEKNNLSIEEFMLLYLNYKDFNLEEVEQSLINKGVVSRDLFSKNKLVLSSLSSDLISTILIDSPKEIDDQKNRFDSLAEKMIAIFPKGKKAGTTYYWRDSVTVISKKLKSLFLSCKIDYSDEVILKATEEYVKSFNGDYKFMQLLKYFIWKSKKTENGNEFTSELLSFISNAGQEEEMNKDWTSTLK